MARSSTVVTEVVHSERRDGAWQETSKTVTTVTTTEPDTDGYSYTLPRSYWAPAVQPYQWGGAIGDFTGMPVESASSRIYSNLTRNPAAKKREKPR